MLIYKDGQVAHYKEVFKNVSFPASGVPDSFLAEEGALKVSLYKPYDSETQVLVSCEPYVEDGFAYTVKVVDKSEIEVEVVEPVVEETITITDVNISGNISSNFTL
jgi:hypothetical protein